MTSKKKKKIEIIMKAQACCVGSKTFTYTCTREQQKVISFNNLFKVHKIP